jgi:hypothetical protein
MSAPDENEASRAGRGRPPPTLLRFVRSGRGRRGARLAMRKQQAWRMPRPAASSVTREQSARKLRMTCRPVRMAEAQRETHRTRRLRRHDPPAPDLRRGFTTVRWWIPPRTRRRCSAHDRNRDGVIVGPGAGWALLGRRCARPFGASSSTKALVTRIAPSLLCRAEKAPAAGHGALSQLVHLASGHLLADGGCQQGGTVVQAVEADVRGRSPCGGSQVTGSNSEVSFGGRAPAKARRLAVVATEHLQQYPDRP